MLSTCLLRQEVQIELEEGEEELNTLEYSLLLKKNSLLDVGVSGLVQLHCRFEL